eukprot:1006069-Alexandrium_andersonii.AAC.1
MEHLTPSPHQLHTEDQHRPTPRATTSGGQAARKALWRAPARAGSAAAGVAVGTCVSHGRPG